MKPLLLILVMTVCCQALALRQKRTKPQPNVPSELARLREDYIAAAKEYKTSLEKLLSLYENNVTKSEGKLELARKLHAEGLTTQEVVDEDARAILKEKEKANKTRKQLAEADDQIKNTLSDAQLEEEYHRAVAARRRTAAPTCRNWTLTAYRRQQRRTTTVAFKLVCQN
jgi:hypothetical protein